MVTFGNALSTSLAVTDIHELCLALLFALAFNLNHSQCKRAIVFQTAQTKGESKMKNLKTVLSILADSILLHTKVSFGVIANTFLQKRSTPSRACV